MSYLLDTSVLGRLANTADTFYPVADRAVFELRRRGEELFISPQNLIEFRNVATRPKAVNGLGYSISEAELKSAKFEAIFPLLPETPGIFPAWKSLVKAAGVSGKRVHDARLVAICHVHGVQNLLTFNISHFTSLAKFGPGIVVVDPASV